MNYIHTIIPLVLCCGKIGMRCIRLGISVDMNTSVLYMRRRDPISNVYQTFESGTITIVEPDYEFISFRQPLIKDYLRDEENQMIDNKTQEQVDIFSTLCEVLCSGEQNYVESEGVGSRRSLQFYAALHFTQHLYEIKVEKSTENQALSVFEAIVRVLSNENNVCAVFEQLLVVMGQLKPEDDGTESAIYEVFEGLTSEHKGLEILDKWTEKVADSKDKLTSKARVWFDARIKSKDKHSKRLLKKLACGFLENLATMITAESAKIPYKLVYHTLRTVSFDISHLNSCHLMY